MKQDSEVEMLDVVDQDDRFITIEKRKEIHRKRLLHRAVHVFVFDEKRRIYLQKRALTKDQDPGRWDSSASGHVDSGESYSVAAVRELEEELGMRVPLEKVLKVSACERTDGEHSMLFVAELNQGDPRPMANPEEILEGRFFLEDEIWKDMEHNPYKFTSSFRYLFSMYRKKRTE